MRILETKKIGLSNDNSEIHFHTDINTIDREIKEDVNWYSIEMTSNNAPSPYVASSSLTYNTSTLPYEAFNTQVNDSWFTKVLANAWIQLDFGLEVLVNSYSLKSVNTNGSVTSAMPKKWELRGSNDGSNWDVLDSRDNVSFISGNSIQFDFKNKKKYSKYRLFIYSNNGSTTYTGISQFKFGYREVVENKTFILSNSEYKKFNEKIPATKGDNLIPKMTSNTLPTGVASASSVYSTTYDAWKAFNMTDNSFWQTASNMVAGSWLQYEFKESEIIDKYSIKNASSTNNIIYYPTKWNLLGSNNGVDWVTLDTRSDITFLSGEEKTFEFSNSEYFKTYRIYILGGNSSVGIIIDEIKLYEKILPAIPSSWRTVSTTLPTQSQFETEGMDYLMLFDRKVMELEPLSMTDKSDIVSVDETGKVFSKTINLKSYVDIKNIRVDVK